MFCKLCVIWNTLAYKKQSLFIFAGWGTPPPGIRTHGAAAAVAGGRNCMRSGRLGGRVRLRAHYAAADREIKENKQVFCPTHK